MQHQITAPLREYVAAIREYDATAPFCRASAESATRFDAACLRLAKAARHPRVKAAKCAS